MRKCWPEKSPTFKTVLIVDDQPIFRAALRTLLTTELGWDLVGEVSSVSFGVELAIRCSPALILVGLKNLICFELIKKLRLANINSTIVVLIDRYSDEFSWETVGTGAVYCLPRNISETAFKEQLIRLNYTNGLAQLSPLACEFKSGTPMLAEINLTKQESKILALLATGKCNKLIGRDLNITESTVKAHLKKAYKKLNCNSRAEAVSLLIKNRSIIKFVPNTIC